MLIFFSFKIERIIERERHYTITTHFKNCFFLLIRIRSFCILFLYVLFTEIV